MNAGNKPTQYQKMTETPIPQLITALSVPTILSMLVTNVYNLADTAFVGRLGTSASGAVGIVFGFMSIIQAFGFMFGQGSGSIIARLLGKQETEEASSTASTGFFSVIFLTILVEILCFLLLDPLIFALGSTPTIAPYAKTYITYILLASPFMTSSFVLNNILRYEGKAALGMIGLMTGGLCNILGDAFFMFGLHMGIAGAGLSTALSQCLSFGILLSMFLTGRTETRLSVYKVRLQPLLLFNIITTGLPSLVRQGLNSITTVLLNSEAALYGDAAVAAMSIVSRISFFVFAFALGIGQGFQPVSGFNYGAGKYSRVRKAFRFTGILAESIILAAALCVSLFSGSLVQLFRDDPEVITIGTRALRLHCLALPLLPVCMVTEMLYQSCGKRLGATLLSSLRSGLFFIPSLLVLSRIRGLSGIQEAQPVAYVLSFIPSLCFALHFLKRLPKEDASS